MSEHHEQRVLLGGTHYHGIKPMPRTHEVGVAVVGGHVDDHAAEDDGRERQAHWHQREEQQYPRPVLGLLALERDARREVLRSLPAAKAQAATDERQSKPRHVTRIKQATRTAGCFFFRLAANDVVRFGCSSSVLGAASSSLSLPAIAPKWPRPLGTAG
ncbi:hypothetical protein ON010_g9553 [Phytophthora cinnamomi]|nr:hypothetical protein ON010_g9553 [Phytophthora cinnamomi]